MSRAGRFPGQQIRRPISLHDVAREEQVARVTSVGKSVTIDSSPHELYEFWRNLSNLPRFFEHLRTVEAIDERRSRWTAAGPKGTTVRWEAEITDDQPGRSIAWQRPGQSLSSWTIASSNHWSSRVW